MKWRVYFGDGTTFDNTQGHPWEVPNKGVICVIQPDLVRQPYNVGQDIQFEKDWYLCIGGRWLGVSTSGLKMHLKNDFERKIESAREGIAILFEDYRDILDIALADQDFPKASAKRQSRETDV